MDYGHRMNAIKRPLLVKDNKIFQIGYRTKYKDLNLV
ncbi:hypothetical protein SAN_1691 [Streptococcus agalactiae COH1]|nr:hypothetical protein SAN_1691 [Streptococcus agalactiae COH1]